MSDGTPLDRVRYASFGSYRKNGTLVPTPVWIAPLDGKLVVFTLRETYKVKRVRNNPKVRLAECDVRGKLLGETFYDGTCAIVTEPAHEKRAYASFRKKYGLLMRLSDIGSSLSGRMKRRLILEVTLDDYPPSG